MKKKICYQLFSNRAKKSRNVLAYSYANTKGIELTVSGNGFFIEVMRTVKIEPDKITEDKLFKDAIKKACMIQLIKYGKISFSKLTVKIDDETFVIYDKVAINEPLVYGMCGNQLLRKMSSNWGEPQFQRILNTTKSKQNRLDAALNALLVSKSKQMETERFIYLWMAMNGLYGYMAEQAAGHVSKNGKGWIKKEFAQIKFFTMFYEYPYFPTDIKAGNENKLMHKILSVMARISKENFDVFLKDLKSAQFDNALVADIYQLMDEYLTNCRSQAYAMLLMWIPYHFRCKYFHSEKAIPLLSFRDEYPLPALSVMNGILEDFLDQHLYRWFDDEDVEKEYSFRIKEIAENCKFEKKHLVC